MFSEISKPRIVEKLSAVKIIDYIFFTDTHIYNLNNCNKLCKYCGKIKIYKPNTILSDNIRYIHYKYCMLSNSSISDLKFCSVQHLSNYIKTNNYNSYSYNFNNYYNIRCLNKAFSKIISPATNYLLKLKLEDYIIITTLSLYYVEKQTSNNNLYLYILDFLQNKFIQIVIFIQTINKIYYEYYRNIICIYIIYCIYYIYYNQ